MININNVVLVGRLTKDPELRKTKENISVCQFSLAVDRIYAKEGSQTCDFINCVAWRQSAEFLTQYARKGIPVGVEGKLQTRSYDGQYGKVYVTEIMVEHLSIISPRKEDPAPQGSTYENPVPDYTQEEVSEYQNSPTLDISSDDLPFY